MANPRWTAGDVSGSDSLTDNDHLYPAYFNELREAFDDRSISAKDYGATGDGVTDDTTALTNLLSDGAGKTIIIEEGDYLVSDGLTVGANTTIFAYGARIFDTTTHRSLLTLDDGVTIFGLELEGAGNTSYDTNGKLFYVAGTVSDYIENIKLIDCYAHEAGRAGIRMDYVKHAVIERCRMYECGYKGFEGIAVEDVKVNNCHVKDITPGTASNAYGIGFTRFETTDDLGINPRSKDCFATNNLVENVTIWKGLDTHSGENISFIGNTVKNCKIGVGLSGTNPGGTDDHGSLNCRVIGNTFIGNNDGAGIMIYGASSGINSVTEFAYGHTIANNVIIDHGIEGNVNQGAILMETTLGVSVTGNTFRECTGGAAIVMLYDNYNYSITGNTIYDQNDDTSSSTAAIRVRSGYCVGTISGNTFYRNNDTLNTYVMERGISIDTTTGCETAIGLNYSNTVSQFNGTLNANTWFNHFADDVKFYVGSGTPESSVTAEPGSMYINTSGGAGTTLYLKESGSSNTGWAGV